VAIRDAIKDILDESLLRRRTDEQFERVQAGHEAIFTTIEQGDPAAAERAMAAHFEAAVTSLVYGTIGNDPAADALTQTDDA
jgi:DNA-binding FadR family transcriptional regulator